MGKTMTETNTNAQSQKPKISRLAIASLISGIASITGMFFLPVAGLVSLLFFRRTHFDWIVPFNIYHALLPISIFSIIVGAIGLKKIRRSHGLLTGQGIARTGQFMSIPVLVLASLASLVIFAKGRISKEVMCGTNLSDLGKAMLNYASDNDDQYPTAEKWCDLLIAQCEVSPKQFVCPLSDAKEGESSYTFNENLIGKKFTEVPPDVVILFETKEGWNQFGGPEILTTGNHKYQGEGGCNILFGDSHVSFVRTEQLGELKWEVEQNK